MPGAVVGAWFSLILTAILRDYTIMTAPHHLPVYRWKNQGTDKLSKLPIKAKEFGSGQG